MNPVDSIDPWLSDDIFNVGKQIAATGQQPADEGTRYELAYAMSLELEILDLAVRQLELAKSRWMDAQHQQDVFSRGMLRIREERELMERVRLTYKRALRVLRLSQERKKLRNAVHAAAVECHPAYTTEQIEALRVANAAWTATTQQGDAAA